MFKNNDEPGIELVEWHHSPAMTVDVSILIKANVPATTLFAQGNNTFYADSTGVMHNNLGTAAPVNTDNEFSNQMIMTG